MSLNDLQTEVEGYRAEASRLAEEYAQTQAEVADNPNLTIAGKREQLEPYHYEVVEQITALREREKAAVKAAKEKLERRVFGLSPAASNDPASSPTATRKPGHANSKTATTRRRSISPPSAAATTSWPRPCWREHWFGAGPQSSRTSSHATQVRAKHSMTSPPSPSTRTTDCLTRPTTCRLL